MLTSFLIKLLYVLLCAGLAAAQRCPKDGASRNGVCFDPTSVSYKVLAKEGGTAALLCVVRNLGREVVTWMRNDGRDIPLTVDTLLFAADKTRMRLNVSRSAGEWLLIIDRVRLSDAGQYLCQVELKTGVRISADTAVFSGTRYFPLTCTVRFASRDAKALMTAADGGRGSRRLSIEWYHRGIRQTTEPGAVDISLSWEDSDTAVSVLTIDLVQPGHTGEWVCLKRSAEFGATMETATHTLRVLIRDAADLQQSDSPKQAAAPASSSASLSSAGIGKGLSSHSNSANPRLNLAPLTLLLLPVVSLIIANRLAYQP
uniref:Ig-like domain-containing protein n=1 Tax=Macrostomum lignano TaxID=282301 RepID=A0A1I8GTP4_9PLAT